MRWLSPKLYLPSLVVLAVLGMLMAGCAPEPAAQALPPATVYGPAQPKTLPAPAPVTAAQPAPATQAPLATLAASATLAAPTGGATDAAPNPPSAEAASPAAANPGAPRKAAQVTVLHTNDVFGEVDPCG